MQSPPTPLWISHLCLKMSSFLHLCTCVMPRTFLPSREIYFQFRQLIGFPVWGQLCCGCQGEESYTFFSCNILYPLLEVAFHQRSSTIKGRLPSKVLFCQRSSTVKGRLPSKIVFRQRYSSVKGRLPSETINSGLLLKGSIISGIIWSKKLVVS